MTEHEYQTVLRCQSVAAWGALMRAAEAAEAEWEVPDSTPSGPPFSITFYGAAAKKMSDVAHQMGLPMRGYTVEWDKGGD